MGYTTEFRGQFDLDKPLTIAHMNYLKKFAGTRRMQRDPQKTEELEDSAREAVNLPVGPEGAYFVGAGGFAGQDHDDSITEYNSPPEDQPSLWCQWVPTEDGTAIEWDGGEKFYEYVEWIKYLIENFLQPWGYVLNGEVEWRGEDWEDTGTIIISDNEVSV